MPVEGDDDTDGVGDGDDNGTLLRWALDPSHDEEDDEDDEEEEDDSDSGVTLSRYMRKQVVNDIRSLVRRMQHR